ncbi:MAG TPA: DUF5777 family beta-barrel protein [Candidatus Thermoplasmatota archaeon]
MAACMVLLRTCAAVLAFALLAPAAPAQDATPTPPDPSAEEENPAIPDFTSINLPTTLRLPRHKVAFRVTHRFARPLGDGDFGDLAADFFGFDSGAQIGLELRFGLFAATQFGVYRTSDRTIQLFAQQDLMQQGPRPIGLAAFATFEGADNLHVERSPGIALVASRTFGTRAAFYAVPGWVANTNLIDGEGEENNSFILGLAGRLRLGEVYAIVGEAVPRIGGHRHQETQLGFAFERRAGGHNFQINFGNALGSTLAQVARGGGPVRGVGDAEEGRPWYIGFNLSRKFY